MKKYLILKKGLESLVLGSMKKIIDFKNKISENIIFKIAKFFLYLFVVVLLFVVVIQKVSNNTISVGGYRLFMVVSESMKEEYEVGSILLSKEVKESELKVNDNVVYLGKASNLKGLIITHKIVAIEEKDGERIYTTKGTSNTVEDPKITFDQIYGKIIYKTVVLSFIGRLLMNNITYYFLLSIVAIVVSFEIVSAIYERKEEDVDEEKEE